MIFISSLKFAVIPEFSDELQNASSSLSSCSATNAVLPTTATRCIFSRLRSSFAPPRSTNVTPDRSSVNDRSFRNACSQRFFNSAIQEPPIRPSSLKTRWSGDTSSVVIFIILIAVALQFR